MDYLFLVVGLSLLLCGANVLVDSSVAIAKKAHLSNFIIGFTIIGMGTSSPELFISVSSTLSGHGDMAMGNVIGSNICNILLILGATATILPFAIERQQTRRDIPFSIFTALLITFLACDSIFFGGKNEISTLDACILFGTFIAYMGYVLYKSKGESDDSEVAEQTKYDKMNIFVLLLIAIASLCALLYGGTLFLESAKALATAWGISETVISITIVALGTSLPELITCIFAAMRGNAQLALGNALGSNIFNILFIVGIAGIVKPMQLDSIQVMDYLMLICASILCYLVVFTFGKHKFDKIEGIAFLALFIGYNVVLFLR